MTTNSLPQLQPMDIVLVKGSRFCWISWMVKICTMSSITHVATYIGKGKIIHATLSGVVISDMDDFKGLSIVVTRYREPISDLRRAAMIELMLKHVGDGYNWHGAILAGVHGLLGKWVTNYGTERNDTPSVDKIDKIIMSTCSFSAFIVCVILVFLSNNSIANLAIWPAALYLMVFTSGCLLEARVRSNVILRGTYRFLYVVYACSQLVSSMFIVVLVKSKLALTISIVYFILSILVCVIAIKENLPRRNGFGKASEPGV